MVEEQFINMNYQIVDKYFQNDFTDLIKQILKTKNEKGKVISIFDVGCYVGNFSKKIKDSLKNDYKLNFYLFDPNPNVKHKAEFKFYNIAFSNDDKNNNSLYLNTFFPASGSSLSQIAKNDKLWNFTRKLFLFNFKNKFIEIKIQTKKLDTFCYENNIEHIDVLKIDVEGWGLKVLNGGQKMLKNIDIIQIEILDNKNKFKQQYEAVKTMLEKNKFKLIKEKNILSVSILSNQKACDCLYIKSI